MSRRPSAANLRRRLDDGSCSQYRQYLRSGTRASRLTGGEDWVSALRPPRPAESATAGKLHGLELHLARLVPLEVVEAEQELATARKFRVRQQASAHVLVKLPARPNARVARDELRHRQVDRR